MTVWDDLRQVPGLVRRLQDEVGSLRLRLDAQRAVVDRMNNAVERIEGTHDDRLTRLRSLVSRVEPYQPLYGVNGVITNPARTSRDRAEAIAENLAPLNGRRVLDIGSSLGYMPFYLADRGAHTTGWDLSVDNVEVARLVQSINGIAASFVVTTLDLERADAIDTGQFDAILLLSVLHHVIHFQGLETAQKIVRSLLRAAPVLILELASKDEDPDLFWSESQPDDPLDVLALVADEVTLTKVGDFGTHLSTSTRPLYVVSRERVVEVNGRLYEYETTANEAYSRSPLASGPWPRRYYFGRRHVVKEYMFSAATPDNWNQIIRELYLHTQFSDQETIHHRVELQDWEVTARGARLVLARAPGALLSELSPLPPTQLRSVVRDVLMTLADLRRTGFHHNDVRSWNIIVSDSQGWLIDYGRVAHEALEDDVVALAWAAVAGVQGGREPSDDHKTDLPDLTPLENGPLGAFVDALRTGERDPRALLQHVTDDPGTPEAHGREGRL